MWFIVDSCRRSVSSKYEITTSTSGYVNILIAYKPIKHHGSLPIYMLETESEMESDIFEISDNDEKAWRNFDLFNIFNT